MKAILTALMIVLMAGLTGCATIKMNDVEITDSKRAEVLAKEPPILERAMKGHRIDQYIIGKHNFEGYTKDGKRNMDEALEWLHKSAAQDYMAAWAFMGGSIYGENVIRKHIAGNADSAEDDRLAELYTDKALELWEKAGHKGFQKAEVAALQSAVFVRGAKFQIIRKDHVTAFKYYCDALKIDPDRAATVKRITENMYNIDKRITDCYK